MERYFEELRKLEEAEHIFGEDFIGAIQYGTASDGYLVRVEEYPGVALMKVDSFEANYKKLIRYLMEIKSRIFNRPDLPDSASLYYHDWFNFKTSYNTMKAEFYRQIDDPEDREKVLHFFCEWMGSLNYNTVIADMSISSDDYRGHIDLIFMYLGNTRAVRDLTMKYLDNENGRYWVFHLWNLTPTYITDLYGRIFYLGNEMGELDNCPYSYKATEYYYKEFYERIKSNISNDRCLTDQQKEKAIGELNSSYQINENIFPH